MKYVSFNRHRFNCFLSRSAFRHSRTDRIFLKVDRLYGELFA